MKNLIIHITFMVVATILVIISVISYLNDNGVAAFTQAICALAICMVSDWWDKDTQRNNR